MKFCIYLLSFYMLIMLFGCSLKNEENKKMGIKGNIVDETFVLKENNVKTNNIKKVNENIEYVKYYKCIEKFCDKVYDNLSKYQKWQSDIEEEVVFTYYRIEFDENYNYSFDYIIEDINNDGIKELIIKDWQYIYEVWTLYNDKIVKVAENELIGSLGHGQDVWVILDNGNLMNTITTGSQKEHYIYEINGDKLTLSSYICINEKIKQFIKKNGEEKNISQEEYNKMIKLKSFNNDKNVKKFTAHRGYSGDCQVGIYPHLFIDDNLNEFTLYSIIAPKGAKEFITISDSTSWDNFALTKNFRNKYNEDVGLIESPGEGCSLDNVKVDIKNKMFDFVTTDVNTNVSKHYVIKFVIDDNYYLDDVIIS